MLPRNGRSSLVTLATTFFLTGGLLISGCAMPDLNRELPIADPQPFSASGVVERPEIWWTAFDDDDLNHHLDVAFEENFSLEAARERVLAARALTWRRASDLWPDLNGLADARATFLPGSDPSLFALGLGASYEPDT